MSKVYYREADTEEKEQEVTPQWPLPGMLMFRRNLDEDFHEAAPLDGFPTRDHASQPSNGRTLPQVAVATTATQIAPANPRRKQIKITNTTGTQLVWLGIDGSVTASNGDLLGSTLGSYVMYDIRQAIWGLSATSAQTVAVFETEYLS